MVVLGGDAGPCARRIGAQELPELPELPGEAQGANLRKLRKLRNLPSTLIPDRLLEAGAEVPVPGPTQGAGEPPALQVTPRYPRRRYQRAPGRREPGLVGMPTPCAPGSASSARKSSCQASTPRRGSARSSTSWLRRAARRASRQLRRVEQSSSSGVSSSRAIASTSSCKCLRTAGAPSGRSSSPRVPKRS